MCARGFNNEPTGDYDYDVPEGLQKEGYLTTVIYQGSVIGLDLVHRTAVLVHYERDHDDSVLGVEVISTDDVDTADYYIL